MVLVACCALLLTAACIAAIAWAPRALGSRGVVPLRLGQAAQCLGAAAAAAPEGPAAGTAADGVVPGPGVYRFVDYTGTNTTLQTRSCGHVAGLRANRTLGQRSAQPRLLIDSFPFLNESDILEARLTEYWDLVDAWIILESAVAHSGAPKPLNQLCGRFAPYLSKIVHVVVSPARYAQLGKDAWKFEAEHQVRAGLLARQGRAAAGACRRLYTCA